MIGSLSGGLKSCVELEMLGTVGEGRMRDIILGGFGDKERRRTRREEEGMLLLKVSKKKDRPSPSLFEMPHSGGF